ncbi:hypothetical protein T12_3537 [Trichinella patagoniensis]|uniref:Uncharacterized protein n=1 Tax=Trichinella patagoniensis TaxID=990121 RepID=A0A0V0ZI56_9BILA|nr:hypothetical protein T12_3537 [Trichinella patagoniensis]
MSEIYSAFDPEHEAAAWPRHGGLGGQAGPPVQEVCSRAAGRLRRGAESGLLRATVPHAHTAEEIGVPPGEMARAVDDPRGAGAGGHRAPGRARPGSPTPPSAAGSAAQTADAPCLPGHPADGSTATGSGRVPGDRAAVMGTRTRAAPKLGGSLPTLGARGGIPRPGSAELPQKHWAGRHVSRTQDQAVEYSTADSRRIHLHCS